MRKPIIIRGACALAIGSTLLLAPALAQKASSPASGQAHSHAHGNSEKDIYNGYFKDSQIKARPLSDWAGDWQSAYPLLLDGTLDPVMKHKAKHGDKSADDYRAYYEVGYKSDVDRIVIKDTSVVFYRAGKPVEAKYAADGYEILTYKKGNRGVRFIFKKIGGDETAPVFIQFSDHKIAPEKSGHYHLYGGNDRSGLLKEVTNWPTYYPSALTGKQIVEEMLRH